MNETKEAVEFVENILSHSEGRTKVYDPVKRREYYLRNRQLKGRRKGTVIEDPNDPNKIKTKSPTIKQIAANLQAWKIAQARLTQQKLATIERQARQKIAALPKPSGSLSPQTRARLEEAHLQAVAEIEKDAKGKMIQVINSAKAYRNNKLKQVKAVIKKTERDLKNGSKSKTATGRRH